MSGLRRANSVASASRRNAARQRATSGNVATPSVRLEGRSRPRRPGLSPSSPGGVEGGGPGSAVGTVVATAYLLGPRPAPAPTGTRSSADDPTASATANMSGG